MKLHTIWAILMASITPMHGEPSRQDIADTLINAAIQISAGVIEKQGDFDPHAVCVDDTGKRVNVYPWFEDIPTSNEEKIDFLKKTCSKFQDEKKIASYAIVYDSYLTFDDPSDKKTAILIDITLGTGEHLVIAAPYILADKKTKVAQPFRIE